MTDVVALCYTSKVCGGGDMKNYISVLYKVLWVDRHRVSWEIKKRKERENVQGSCSDNSRYIHWQFPFSTFHLHQWLPQAKYHFQWQAHWRDCLLLLCTPKRILHQDSHRTICKCMCWALFQFTKRSPWYLAYYREQEWHTTIQMTTWTERKSWKSRQALSLLITNS